MNNIEDDIDLIKAYLKAMKDVEMGSDVVLLIAIQNLVKEYENLIKENKELKDKCKELNFKYTAQWVDDNFIPKSKVKEKIKHYEEESKKKPYDKCFYDIYIRELQELLEEVE